MEFFFSIRSGLRLEVKSECVQWTWPSVGQQHKQKMKRNFFMQKHEQSLKINDLIVRKVTSFLFAFCFYTLSFCSITLLLCYKNGVCFIINWMIHFRKAAKWRADAKHSPKNVRKFLKKFHRFSLWPPMTRRQISRKMSKS